MFKKRQIVLDLLDQLLSFDLSPEIQSQVVMTKEKVARGENSYFELLGHLLRTIDRLRLKGIYQPSAAEIKIIDELRRKQQYKVAWFGY
ncbi:hypothetical protein [Weissella minor]|uniref:hypothetical protein n=2 Tax=Weissella minor TaxID=1620 RepID=UPI003AF24131